MEHWKEIEGYKGHYWVSDQGRVCSFPHRDRMGRKYEFKMLSISHAPYSQVCLSGDGGPKVRRVHELVLKAFKGSAPPGTVACHWDDDKTNARLCNLRYDTEAANIADRKRNGIRIGKGY